MLIRVYPTMSRILWLLAAAALWMPGRFAEAESSAPLPPSAAAEANLFACGGDVEAQVWSSWDGGIRNFLETALVNERLLQNQDANALYDIQVYAHNLVSMARRCHRTARLSELGQVVGNAYRALTPGSFFSPGRRWLCRGGSICRASLKLINREVVLYSVQFLALSSAVANAVATSGTPLAPEDRRFVESTVGTTMDHLLRWGSDAAIAELGRLSKARPSDVVDGSSRLFFTDQHLWMIALYAELAGILAQHPEIRAGLAGSNVAGLARMREHLTALLQLFSARTSNFRISSSRIGDVEVADLDRGYWRLHSDSRYAGYEYEDKPVVCEPGGGAPPQVRIPASTVTPRQDIGWDISHARRLVHALDSVERNREAMLTIFSLTDGALPPRSQTQSFANNLVAVVWNGDSASPLFSNYWSGANGWYRVAYEASGGCADGYPPYGMSTSFMTGGYITWTKYRPEIGLLGKNLYSLMRDPAGQNSAFVAKYYPDLGAAANQDSRALNLFMFLPTLVEVGIQ